MRLMIFIRDRTLVLVTPISTVMDQRILEGHMLNLPLAARALHAFHIHDKLLSTEETC